MDYLTASNHLLRPPTNYLKTQSTYSPIIAACGKAFPQNWGKGGEGFLPLGGLAVLGINIDFLRLLVGIRDLHFEHWSSDMNHGSLCICSLKYCSSPTCLINSICVSIQSI